MVKQPASHRPALRAFTRLSRAQLLIQADIERALKAAGLPALGWHDVLAELSAAPGQQLRPGDLGASLMVAQYNLSRLLDRMEAARLVRRIAVDGDARGQWLALTPDGASTLVQTASVAGFAADQALAGQLDGDDIKKLSKLLRRIATPQPAGD